MKAAHFHATVDQAAVRCDPASSDRTPNHEANESPGFKGGVTMRADAPVARIAKATSTLAAAWVRPHACLDSLGDETWKPELSGLRIPPDQSITEWPDVSVDGGFRVRRSLVDGKQRMVTSHQKVSNVSCMIFSAIGLREHAVLEMMLLKICCKLQVRFIKIAVGSQACRPFSGHAMVAESSQ